jgi:hypothetical protein
MWDFTEKLSELILILIFCIFNIYNLYGCEIWSLTLREEHKLNVFENRVLRGIFGLKRDEIVGG